MADELERFIRKNRDSFDSELPNDAVWGRIKKKVSKKTVHPMQQAWRIAAVLLLMSTVYLSVDRMIRSDQQDMVTDKPMEFEQVERYYSRLIMDKKAEIAHFAKSDLKNDFMEEIERLDNMYDELKETYVKQNAADRVLDAMINNLKLRMDILNQQLNLLKKLKEAKDENQSIESV